MTDHEEALELVHRGWDHLRRERPIAARACWRQALRVSPDDPAASQALHTLRTSSEMPEAARKEWRFRPPTTEERRARWDQRLRGDDLENLERAEAAFRELITEDAYDHEARFNRALCLAWMGRNAQAIRKLRALIARSAEAQPDAAEEAWLLAEVLRAGAGAEQEADDLSHAWLIPIRPGEPELRKDLILKPIVLDPTAPSIASQVFEWLDRDFPTTTAELRPETLPRVLATWVESPGRLRIASPDPSLLDEAADLLGPLRERAERTASPLPLPLLDAGLWTFRLPPGLDVETSRRLTRESVERRLEDQWIHWPRHGLDGQSPLNAAQKAAAGDPEARVMLSAVVRFREQLGERPATAELYGGYPFSRLRRRLDLALDSADPTPESTDLSCAGLTELSTIDPTRLDDPSLAEAAGSAAGLRDDAVTEKLTAALFERGARAIALAVRDLPKLIAAGVRRGLARNDEPAALRWIERAETADPDRAARYRIWRAEILAKLGDVDAVIQAYSEALDLDPSSGQALQAAESTLAQGLPEAALELAGRARDLAANPTEKAQAEAFLASLRDGTAHVRPD